MHFEQLRRRDFVTLLGGAAVVWPLGARAQQTRKVPRIGILDFFPSAASADIIEPFQHGLRELGYVDGRNIHVEYHSAEQRSDLAATIAADLVRREVDIIVAVATPAAHAAKNATATIPIVMQVSDPLATGLVASLARPGGNLTGVSSSGPDLAGKRLELLRELRPGLARVAFLGAANDPNTRTFLNETQAAADSIRVHLQPLLVTGPEEFDAAFATMIKERAQGLIVQPLFVGHRAKLADLAVRHHLPMMADQRAFAMAGGLAAYGVNRPALVRRWAFYVDKILKGAKPADLPVEQPTKFELVINLKTARALGLDVPWFLQQRADEVIE
jgi:putative tryptophan/tyrosine transport system substrate-binding protein